MAEGYLSAERVRAVPEREAVRPRPFDADFAEAAAAELPGAYRLAGYLLADATDAQDAVQEACLRAWRGWPGLRDRSAFHSWFSQIVVNVCRTRLERRSRHRSSSLDTLGELDVEDTDPFRSALAGDAVGRVLPILSPELRVVIVLRYWGELSLAEIADRLRIPVGTVKSRHHAALHALRRAIEAAEGGAG